MLFALQMVDFGVVLLFFAALLAIGLYFRPEQQTSSDFFLGGRSLGWFPVGLSLIATSCAGLVSTSMPGEAYEVGLKLLLLPVTLWMTAPLLLWYFLPLYRGLELDSVYEYLELRFDAKIRLVASLLFVVWRLIWLVATLYVPCQLLIVAAEVQVPPVMLISVIGLGSTICTLLGGMKGVAWASVLQSLVMVAGVFAIILGAWWGLADGMTRVWEVATALGRNQFIETEFSWRSSWTVWGLVPYSFLSMLYFQVADQIAAQRYLSTRSLLEAQRSYLFHCVLASVLLPCLVYAGLCLLAYYHDNPSAIRTKWVINVDGETRRPLTYADRARFLGRLPDVDEEQQPLIDWNDPHDSVTVESIDRLVAERRLLHPNRKTPLENAGDLIDTDHPDRLDLEQLATRQPPRSTLRRGEVVLLRRANEELLPWFAAHQLPFGIKGLVVAGILAATMLSLNAGVHSIAAVLVMDIHSRYGWGRILERRHVSKTDGEQAASDALRVARKLTFALGLVATACACGLAVLNPGIGDAFRILLRIISTLGASVLATFLLGLFTRRGTAAGALIALFGGILFTAWLTFQPSLGHLWHLTFGTLFTLMVGGVASQFCGVQKDPQSLRGLVVGCGRLGKRGARA